MNHHNWNYQRRPRKAYCVQFDGETIPDLITDDATWRNGHLILRGYLGHLIGTVRPDNWLVCGEDGKIRITDQQEFTSKYEVLNG